MISPATVVQLRSSNFLPVSSSNRESSVLPRMTKVLGPSSIILLTLLHPRPVFLQ